MIDCKEDFKIVGYHGEYVLVNIKGENSNHTHITNKGTCKLLIDLVVKQVVPNSNYLRTSAKRISRNPKYIQKINIKIEKDKNKQKYFNSNKGVRN